MSLCWEGIYAKEFYLAEIENNWNYNELIEVFKQNQNLSLKNTATKQV